MSGPAPEVSIVLPTHDRPRLLSLTLTSILWQEDIDLEVIDEATGRLLAVDDDGTSYCIGDFYKARAGYITIRVANLGRFSNTYNVYIR